jgi:hypothetical protein
MKISVDVDCTPEEARRFLGLPDLTPVQRAYVERTTAAAAEGVSPETYVEIARQWRPTGEASIQIWKAMLEGASSRRDV